MNGKVGNQLTLTNQNLCVFILHFNYAMNGTAENNIIWGGFKSALTNGKDVTLADAKYNTTLTDGTVCFTMNHRGQTSSANSNGYYSTNYGGWKGSDLRYDILGATSQAPSQYNTDKNTSCVGYDATAATLTSPKSDTLLAKFEVQCARTYANEYEKNHQKQILWLTPETANFSLIFME